MAPLHWNRDAGALELSGVESQLAAIIRSPAFRRALLILILAGLVAHGRTVSFGFLGETDDQLNFVSNERLHPATLASVAQIWAQPRLFLYIPFTETLWWLCQVVATTLGAPLSTVVRTAQLAAHLINGMLVYVICAWLLRCRSALSCAVGSLDLAALAGALVFLVHPVQSQILGTATGTKQVFALLPALLACLAAFSYFESGAKGALAASTCLLAAAMLGNTSLVALPIVFALSAWLVFGTDPLRIAKSLGVWLPLAALIGCLGLTARPETVAVDLRAPPPTYVAGSLPGRVPLVPAWLKPFRALDDLAFYVKQTIVPYPLLDEYEGRFFVQRMSSPLVWLEIALTAAGLLAITCLLRRRRLEPIAGFGLLWALVTIAPVLGLTLILEQSHSDVADRYMYPWLVGVGLIAAAASRRLTVSRARATIAALTMAFVIATVIQQTVWSSDSALFDDLLRHEPDSWLAHWSLGETYKRVGDYEQAERHFREGYRLYRSYHDVTGVYPLAPEDWILISFKQLLVQTGKIDELLALYERRSREDPHSSLSHFGLGNVLILEGDLKRGLEELTRAEMIEPAARSRRFTLGEAYIRHFPRSYAVSALKEALRRRPDYVSLSAMVALAQEK